MKIKYREIHRSEIKRRMYRIIDRRWEGIYYILTVIVISVFFGGSLMYTAKSAATVFFGGLFLVVGLMFLGLYVLLLRRLKRSDENVELPRNIDQIIFATICLVTVYFASNSELGLLAGFSLAYAYATQRLWRRANSFWRLWFFRAGRQYFREVSSYKGTNKQKQRTL